MTNFIIHHDAEPAMRFTAQCLMIEPSYRVTGVVFASQRLSLDWEESGKVGHLLAVSTDGVTFTGQYGYPQPDDHCHVRLTLFKSAVKELLFIGPWWNTQSGNGGEWAIRLTPQPAA